MMSTFSRVSGTQDDVIGDEDDDDPTMSSSSFQNVPVDSKPPADSITSNGTDKASDEPSAATSDGKPKVTLEEDTCCLYNFLSAHENLEISLIVCISSYLSYTQGVVTRFTNSLSIATL